MQETTNFYTAGQLKKVLENVPDDRIIVAQVVGKDGGAWNMHASITPLVNEGTIGVITLSHPDLKSLPNFTGIPTKNELEAAIKIINKEQPGSSTVFLQFKQEDDLKRFLKQIDLGWAGYTPDDRSRAMIHFLGYRIIVQVNRFLTTNYILYHYVNTKFVTK